MNEVVYSADNSEKRKYLSLSRMFTDLYAAGFLGKQLFIRDVKGMFRQSIFGILWAFAPPFFTAAIWIFLKYTGAISLGDVGMPYPVFVVSGTILFQTFSEALRAPSESVQEGKSIMVKLNFPREALLIRGFYKVLFNLFFKIIALTIVLLLFQNQITFYSLLFFPLITLVAFVGYSAGVLLISIQLLYQDVNRIMTLLMQVMMYLTPVVFAIPSEGFLKHIIQYNPLSSLVVFPRSVLTGMDWDMGMAFFVNCLGAVVLFFVGWLVFRITMPIIIERSGS